MPKTLSFGRGASVAAVLAMTMATSAVAQQTDNDNYGPPPGVPSDQLQREDGPPPPPAGYDDQYDASAQARAEDDAYARRAQDWASRYCYRRSDNAAGGAIIGGVLGALLGGGIAGRGNHTSGALIGGAVGAVAGASVGASSTSPGCPPGMVVRDDAAPLPYAFSGGYVYAAPPDYRPWIWVDGRWLYRPYPYHRYWYRSHDYRR